MNLSTIIIFSIILIYIVIITIIRLRHPWLMAEEDKQALYSTMEKVDKTMEANNIPYFIICGTLLGAVRHQEIIPWDDDIDIGVFEEDLDRVNNLFKNYVKFIPASKGGCGKIYANNKVAIDIFPFTKNGTKYEYLEDLAKSKWPGEYFEENEMLPLQKNYKLGELTLWGPKQFLPYAERAWGKNWKKPSLKLGKKFIYPDIAIKMMFM